MLPKPTIGVIACDLRQVYMARMLAKEGYKIHLVYSSQLDKEKLCMIMLDCNSYEQSNLRITSDITDILMSSDVIAGPVPFNKICEFITIPKFIQALINKNNTDKQAIHDSINYSLLYAGVIDSEYKTMLNEYGIDYVDFMEIEELAVFNTIATAEGIIAEAILHKETNLHGSECMVLGYGKCAKTLANKLKGIGANVTVVARNPMDLTTASSLGYSTLNIASLKNHIYCFEYIFNTIPHMILDSFVLEHVNKESVIFDIASIPGGVDKQYATKNGIRLVHSLGIPGKYAPKSSGEAIGEYLIEYINRKFNT